MRLLGSAIGTAMAGSVYAHQLDINRAGTTEQIAVVQSFQFVMLIAALISTFSVVTAVLTGQPKKSSAGAGVGE
jgi:hypothetical protein